MRLRHSAPFLGPVIQVKKKPYTACQRETGREKGDFEFLVVGVLVNYPTGGGVFWRCKHRDAIHTSAPSLWYLFPFEFAPLAALPAVYSKQPNKGGPRAVASENRRGTACDGVRVALRLCRSLLPLAFDLEMSSDRVQLRALRAAAESADLFASERLPVDGGIPSRRMSRGFESDCRRAGRFGACAARADPAHVPSPEPAMHADERLRASSRGQ